MSLDFYKIQLNLLTDMLATNSSDPNILDTHIIERQRKLITQNNSLNREINKYQDAIQISPEQQQLEKDALVDRLEKMLGKDLSDDERKAVASGNLEALKETFKELDLKGTTVFYWDKEKDLPKISTHMIYGFLKAAGDAICKNYATKPGKMLRSSAYTSSIINKHVSTTTKFATFDKDVKRTDKGAPYCFPRPLRGNTPKGERITLVASEMVPAGAKLDFTLKVLSGDRPTMTKTILLELFDYGSLKGLGQWRNADWGQFDYELTRVDRDGKPIDEPKKVKTEVEATL